MGDILQWRGYCFVFSWMMKALSTSHTGRTQLQLTLHYSTLVPYVRKTEKGLVYVALMNSNGEAASIDITEIALEVTYISTRYGFEFSAHIFTKRIKKLIEFQCEQRHSS